LREFLEHSRLFGIFIYLFIFIFYASGRMRKGWI